jgi:hypothetical protein
VYIDQRDPDENQSYKSGILTASAPGENARIVIHFDLGGWGPDSISQARLHLWHWRGGNYSGSRTLEVCPLTSGFDESTATWNFPWTTPGGDYDNSITASADVDSACSSWVEWNVTEILKNRLRIVRKHHISNSNAIEKIPCLISKSPPARPVWRLQMIKIHPGISHWDRTFPTPSITEPFLRLNCQDLDG